MDGKDLFMCGKLKQRKNERKLRLRLPVSMRKWQRKPNRQMQNRGQALNGLPYENKNLKQLAFNMLLRKPECQRRKPRNLGVERSSRLTIKRAEHTQGVDAWRYVKHVVVSLVWPECQRRLQDNPEFVPMEDGAASHSAQYTSREREKQGITKFE